MTELPEWPRVNVLGVGISAINMAEAIATIQGWITRHDQHYVCVTPVHSVMECLRDPQLRLLFNRSGLTTPDGMPLVWLSRLAGYRHVERVYGPDLMAALCAESVARGYRHFLYGGEAGVAADLAERLRQRFPGLRIVGTHSPPYRPLSAAEDAEICQLINAAAPDIVWIGLSAPKQERWMAAHRASLSAPVLIGVGAAFDFYTGRVSQAPRWMQRSGLEWLYRLWQEPRRLWRRYLVDNPLFLANLLLQRTGLRRFEIEQ